MDTASEKTLCVMGLFDDNANDAFNRLFDRLAKHGIELTDQEPHLTFGIYNRLDADKLLSWISDIAKIQPAVDVYFNHIGLFVPGICIAEPCANSELLNLHRHIHLRFDQDCLSTNCLFSLKSKSWIPHTTLAVLPSDKVGHFIPAVLEEFVPFHATITALSITERAPLKYLQKFPLLK
ncbi:MAG: 2'-5' RNA ligase family protein [Oscillospiraceae bacterium]